MNYSWDTHAYQQSNRISPPSATDCTRSVSVTIASTSDHGLTGTNRDRPGLGLALAGWGSILSLPLSGHEADSGPFRARGPEDSEPEPLLPRIHDVDICEVAQDEVIVSS